MDEIRKMALQAALGIGAHMHADAKDTIKSAKLIEEYLRGDKKDASPTP